jgi:hypothetical protein
MGAVHIIRYDPKRDGRPSDGNCDGCESLHVIHPYTKIAKKRAESAVRAPTDREEHKGNDVEPSSEPGDES